MRAFVVSPGLMFVRVLRVIIPSLLLVACGGGGGGSASVQDALNPVAPEDEKATVSGVVTINPYNRVDADLPDGTQFPVPSLNNSLASAQRLDTPAVLGGYISGSQGSYFDGGGYGTDVEDIFVAELTEGQLIELRFYAADEFLSARFSLSVELRPVDTFTSVVAQDSISAAGSALLIVPDDPASDDAQEYFIRIVASTGSDPAMYLLSLSDNGGAATRQSLLSNNSYMEQFINTDFVPGELVLSLKGAKATSSSNRVKLSNTLAQKGMRLKAKAGRNAHAYVVEEHSLSLAMSVEQEKGMTPGQARKWQTLKYIDELRKRDEVEFVEPNFIYRASTISSPADIGDAQYASQWNMPLVDAPTAWQSADGSGSIVAVIDTGAILNHEDLDDNYQDGYDFVSLEEIEGDATLGPDNDPTDTGGAPYHGSHVAGIVAAEGNLTGIRGLAYASRVMPLRALGTDGSGTSVDIANAILYAAGLANAANVLPTQPADVINLSLGSPQPSRLMQEAVNLALEEGLIIVAAAGNESSNIPVYPAAFGGVIGVSSVDQSKDRSFFSNYGAYVDIAAPGGSPGILGTTSANQYDLLIGTSMATPHVAGMAALMKSLNPALTPRDFEAYLVAGSLTEDIDKPSLSDKTNRDFFGAGLMNANMAVSTMLSASPVPDTIQFSPFEIGFNESQQSRSLSFSNVGNSALSIESIAPSEPWLQVTSTADPLSFLVSVDLSSASSIDDAVLDVSYRFDGILQPESAQVAVTVTQGSGEVGDIFVYLLDASTNDIAFGGEAIELNGRHLFVIEDVDPGLYFLTASTDRDFDNYIFDLGEAIGDYPDLSSPLLVNVGSNDLSGLNFEVAYSALFDTSALGESGTSTRAMSRAPVQKNAALLKKPSQTMSK